jgi:hypothetical protein
MEGKPDGRQTRPKPALLTPSRHPFGTQHAIVDRLVDAVRGDVAGAATVYLTSRKENKLRRAAAA